MSTQNKLASKELRIINFIIDLTIVSFLAMPFAMVTNILHLITPEIEKYILLLLFLCYYIIFETITSRTFGKRITRTKVVTIDYQKPTFKHILLRTLLRFNPFDLFSYAFGLSVGSHDYYSKTRVVKVN